MRRLRALVPVLFLALSGCSVIAPSYDGLDVDASWTQTTFALMADMERAGTALLWVLGILGL